MTETKKMCEVLQACPCMYGTFCLSKDFAFKINSFSILWFCPDLKGLHSPSLGCEVLLNMLWALSLTLCVLHGGKNDHSEQGADVTVYSSPKM